MRQPFERSGLQDVLVPTCRQLSVTSPSIAVNGPRSVTEKPVPFAFGWMNFTLNAFVQVPPPLIDQRTVTALIAPEAVAGWVRSTNVCCDDVNWIVPDCGSSYGIFFSSASDG